MKRYLLFLVVLVSFCFNWNRVEAKSKLSREEKECAELDHNRFRYYNTQTGSYLSKDPIGLLGGFSLYSYVSDSNTFVDLFGWEDIWFRALSLDDMTSVDSGIGIIPKNPTANATALEHVLGGSNPGYGDQFISLTKDEKLAQIWATKSNTNVAVIDLDQVSNNKLDLSTGDGRKMHLGDASLGDELVVKGNKYARGAKELLVEGQMDQKAIKETYDPKTKLKSKPYP